ncbi:class I SAM-dependent methyltransferase [Flammeovirgaceae bacterium SG7u.111]|nr:class I SAM-dependent methyltransferase [Flammeovirgaceae bacterium SG7u.132]WPO35798.1 class I SAM-dependent methyltransferase [Flammeovirgaceae bacterium SG7u.111]
MENVQIVGAKPNKKIVNDSNLCFYQNIEVEKFKDFARQIGLENGPDIEAIYPHIERAKHVVEIGAGYGRALDKVLEKGYQGSLSAIERVPHLISYMKQKFGSKVRLFQQDAKEITLPYQADCMLWLWSGIMEMSKAEYTKAFHKMYAQLSKNGKLIVETPYKEIKVLGEFCEENHIVFETEWGKIDAYWPKASELKKAAFNCGFQKAEEVVYQTARGIDRIIYVLYK